MICCDCPSRPDCPRCLDHCTLESESWLARAGLGRKSVACVLLLALRRKDFPVDVNVARICARLGWIPLDSEEAIEVPGVEDMIDDQLEYQENMHACGWLCRCVQVHAMHTIALQVLICFLWFADVLSRELPASTCCRRWTCMHLRKRCMSTCAPGEYLRLMHATLFAM